MAKKEGPDQVLISVHMPKAVIDALDELARRGVIPSRSEAIRQAVTEYIAKYMCAFTALNKAVKADKALEEEAFYQLLVKGRA
jgi:Arc/MetJ-type ribon-helix-helix transcriptional regulator